MFRLATANQVCHFLRIVHQVYQSRHSSRFDENLETFVPEYPIGIDLCWADALFVEHSGPSTHCQNP